MVLERAIPFLEDDFRGVGTGLRCYELLEVADCVVGVAFDTDFLAKTIIARATSVELLRKMKYGECA